MGWLKPHRRLAVLTAVIVAVAGGIVVWFLTSPSNNGGLSMGYYGPDKQQEWAERLVAGLDTHDSEQVPILRINGKQRTHQKLTVEAAMPAPGCRYELLSVEDRGRQGVQDVPGLRGQSPTYLFDMTVEETCSRHGARTHEIGVMAVAEMGYWEPSYFVVQDDL